MFFHPKTFKSENNNPWFNILLHTQSIVCATVDSQCLEYLGYITLGAPQFFLLNVSLPKVHMAIHVMEFQVCECNVFVAWEYSMYFKELFDIFWNGMMMSLLTKLAPLFTNITFLSLNEIKSTYTIIKT